MATKKTPRPRIFLLAALGGAVAIGAALLSLRAGQTLAIPHRGLDVEINSALTDMRVLDALLRTGVDGAAPAELALLADAESTLGVLLDGEHHPHRADEASEVDSVESLVSRLRIEVEELRQYVGMPPGSVTAARPRLDSVFRDFQTVSEGLSAYLSRLEDRRPRAFAAAELQLLVAVSLISVVLTILVWQMERREILSMTRLTESHTRTRAILEAIPDMVVRNSADGEFLDVMPAADFDPLVPPADFVGKSVRDVMPPELAKKAMEDIRAVHEGQPLRTQEYSLPSPRGERFYEYRMVRSGPGEVLSIVRDVTDRTRSEQRLKESEARFRTLAENSPVGIFQNESSGDCVYVNNRCAEMLGREPEDLLANEWLRFIHPADTSRVAARWVECVHEERVFQEEYRWVTPEGGVVFTLGLAVPIRQSGQVVGFVGTLVDVTELRRLEEEVIEIDRRERERIGQDLHDVLGQQLTGIGLLLESLKEQENYNESAAQGVMGRIQEAVRMASAHIRFLARGMLPLGTEDSRIEDALADLVENARALFPVECDLRVASGPIRRAAAVGGDLVENLYHIAQEAVTNGVRHGRATRILVTLEEQGDDIVMTVTDDGEGMVESTEESSGIGVKIMHNRIRLLGGSLTIGRVPETGGTFVEARVPTADTAGTESLSG